VVSLDAGPVRSSARLGAAASLPVEQAVPRDRVQPRRLAATTGIEAPPRAERPLEGVGRDVLGERLITRPHDQEAQQRTGVVRVQALETLSAHSRRIAHHPARCQEPAVSFV
jgi:hypothetical protein